MMDYHHSYKFTIDIIFFYSTIKICFNHCGTKNYENLCVPKNIGMYFVIMFKIFTYRVIQAKRMSQSFIFQFVYMQLNKNLNYFLEACI